MDEAIEIDRQALPRIITMLLALAVLAERVSPLSRPIRGLVLWILRPAEAVAREFIAEVTRTPGHRFADFDAVRTGDSPSDAMRLARRFQALAAALDNLSRHALALWRVRVTRPDNRLSADPTDRRDAAGAQRAGTPCWIRQAYAMLARLIASFALERPRLDTS